MLRVIVFCLVIGCFIGLSTAGPTTAPTTNSADMPRFYIVPVTGALQAGAGKAFVQSVEAARKAKASHVLLLLDTIADNKAEARSILETLVSVHDMKLVSVVRRANAFSALFPLACDEVLVTPDAIVGGVRNPDWIKNHPEGFSTGGITAKMAVERTNRDELLARGFMETSIILGKTDVRDGKAQLVLLDEPGDGKKRPRKNADVLKPKGDLLKLNAETAVQLGLARGTVPDLPNDDLPAGTLVQGADPVVTALGIERWKCAGSAVAIMNKVTESTARREYLESHREELSRLERRIEALELDEQQMASAMQERNYARENLHGGRARRVSENRNARTEVNLAKLRQELKELRERRDTIMRAAPKD